MMSNPSDSNHNQVSQNEVKYVPAGTGPAYCGPGVRMTFLITGAQTGGAFFLGETQVAPGGGPTPHIHHREEESFYVQQGTLALNVGGKELMASVERHAQGLPGFRPRAQWVAEMAKRMGIA